MGHNYQISDMPKSERNGARHEKFQSQFLKFARGSLQHRSLCIAVLAMDISTSEAQGGGPGAGDGGLQRGFGRGEGWRGEQRVRVVVLVVV